MGDPSEVIDLTNSFTLDSPRPRLPSRRTRRRTVPVQYPIDVIDIVDTPVENLPPVVRRRKTKGTKNVAQVSQRVPTDEEVVREHSPLDRGIGTCAICLERFMSQPLSSTKCGHVFCENCLLLSLRQDKKCPTCRKPLRGKNAHHPVFL